MEQYLTVGGFAEAALTEKRSEFIAAVLPVSDPEAAAAFVKARKELHHDARHTVWAFVLKDGRMRYSDDGEPQGTGGQPVLACIQKNGLCDVCVAVTRYFGGILLGAGGLTRAYSSAAALALLAAERVEISVVVQFSITIDYNGFQTLGRWLEGCGAVTQNTDFAEKVTLLGVIRTADFERLAETVREAYSGTVFVAPLETIYYAMPLQQEA